MPGTAHPHPHPHPQHPDRPRPTAHWPLPATGAPAVAAYLRVHLYGAAVGERLLRRCGTAIDPADRPALAPLTGQFSDEVAHARTLLSAITPLGTPGRGAVLLVSATALRMLPAGPRVVDPLTRLGLLEALRTLVVAKRSMWVVLDGAAAVSAPHARRCRELAAQAERQEEILEDLRIRYGRRALG